MYKSFRNSHTEKVDNDYKYENKKKLAVRKFIRFLFLKSEKTKCQMWQFRLIFSSFENGNWMNFYVDNFINFFLIFFKILIQLS